MASKLTFFDIIEKEKQKLCEYVIEKDQFINDTKKQHNTKTNKQHGNTH